MTDNSDIYLKHFDLEHKIHACKKCVKLTGDNHVVLSGKKIPSDFGERPKQVEIMFITESPSTSGVYFYNLNTRSNLRKKLFEQLYAAGLIDEMNLDEFKRRNYYLVDTVKCPFETPEGNNANPPNQAIENCRTFLIQSILVHQPKIICTLGKSSLKPFISNKKLKLSDYAGKILDENYLRSDMSFRNTPIFAGWFPMAMIPQNNKVDTFRALGEYL